MKTFKNIAYMLATILFFIFIADYFNWAAFGGALTSYICGLALDYNIKRSAKQVIK